MLGFHRLLAPAAIAGTLLSPEVLAGDSAKVELGRRLFMDPTVSRGARFGCASCHAPDHGFSDPRVLSADENGPTVRHSQPLLDLKDGVGMHWDGEFFRVRELLVARLGSTSEARAQAQELATRHFEATDGRGTRSAFEDRLRQTAPPYYEGADATITWAAPLARRLEEEGRYAAAFRSAFGSRRVTTERLVDAVEAYVLSLRSGKSAYDRFLEGDGEALSVSAQRGLALFEGRANCASCHAGSRFTDDRFHNTGIASVWGSKVDAGRADRSFLTTDERRFKTPGLRDVARRAPYMHDGSLATLRDVVHYYSRGATPNEGLDRRIRQIGLDDWEVDDLVAFLESLSSDERPGLAPAPARRGRTRVRIEGLDGKPLKGILVSIKPFGDRLGHEGAPGAMVLPTDATGTVTFDFPDWTHVKLEALGLVLGEGQPLPDTLREARLIAAPKGKTVVRVKSPSTLPPRLVAKGTKRGDVVFEKVRGLGGSEALYVTDAPEGSDVISFPAPPPHAQPFRRYAVDFGLGFTQAIDLRPDPDRAPPAPFGPPSVASADPTETGVAERLDERRAK